MGWLSNLFKLGSSKGAESNIQADVTLCAPVSGTLLPLVEVPDIVISEKVMGDGVAIVPEGELIVAPCDGVISRLLPTKNAFAVRQADGLEIYVSFGLESMEVLGEGFNALYGVGDTVKQGDTVLQVDLRLLSSKLKSLITSMIVIKSSGEIERVTAATGQCKAGETPVVWIALKNSDKKSEEATSEASTSEEATSADETNETPESKVTEKVTEDGADKVSESNDKPTV